MTKQNEELNQPCKSSRIHTFYSLFYANGYLSVANVPKPMAKEMSAFFKKLHPKTLILVKFSNFFD
jgi:hypothetical protein